MTAVVAAALGAAAFAWLVRSNRHTLTAQRAEQQHRWVQAGDPRGTFGDYPPTDYE